MKIYGFLIPTKEAEGTHAVCDHFSQLPQEKSLLLNFYWSGADISSVGRMAVY